MVVEITVVSIGSLLVEFQGISPRMIFNVSDIMVVIKKPIENKAKIFIVKNNIAKMIYHL